MTLLYPTSPPHPLTAGTTFPNPHVTAGGQVFHGLGVAASLAADATWLLSFQMPPTLPSGTAKLGITSIANATSGVVNVDPQWGSCPLNDAAGPDTVTYSAEGNQTFTWAAGQNDKFKTLVKVTMDAATVVAGQKVLMKLVFKTSGFTLAVVSTWDAWMLWE